TRRPGRSRRYRSTAKLFGRSRSTCAPCQSRSSCKSIRNGPKHSSCPLGIVVIFPVPVPRNFREISGVFQDSSGSFPLSSARQKRCQGHTIAQNGEPMEAPAGGKRPWPRDRAFVVQLHVEASIAPEGFMGRVEHVTSGQARHFATLAECLAFMARILHERRAPRPCP